MAESPLHKTMKTASAAWLSANGCEIVLYEPEISGFSKHPCRPDCLGVFTRPHHQDFPNWRKYDLIEIEAEPDLRGVETECRKDVERPAMFTYILHPSAIEPDRETLRMPRQWGTLLYGTEGVISIGDGAERMFPHSKLIIPLLCKVILDYQRASCKPPDAVRPAAKAHARLTDQQYIRLVKYLELNPDAALRDAAHELGMDLKDLRRVARAGIAGVAYDYKGRLSLQGTEHKASA